MGLIYLLIGILLIIGIIFTFSGIGVYLIKFYIFFTNFMDKQLSKGNFYWLIILGIIFLLCGGIIIFIFKT